MADENLMELLKLHTQEVHFQVSLNWDRAKSSLAFHAALLAVTAGLTRGPVAVVLFLFLAASACLSAGIILTGHDYYRAARRRQKEVVDALQTQLGFITTTTMRGEKRKWLSITDALVALHVMMAVLALAGLVAYR